MRVPALLTVPVAVLLLAGCTSSPVGSVATPTADVPTSAPVTPKATPTTPPPTQDVADATPVARRCSKLVPADVAAALSPDLALVKGWTPQGADPAARLEALGGTTCLWQDPAGDTLTVAVAKPSAKDATALKNDMVERSQSVPTYGGEAYFQVVDHVGQVDAFRGRLWIQARSNLFFEPGDATRVVAAADTLLGTREATPSPSPSLSASPDPTPSETPAPTETPVG